MVIDFGDTRSNHHSLSTYHCRNPSLPSHPWLETGLFQSF